MKRILIIAILFLCSVSPTMLAQTMDEVHPYHEGMAAFKQNGKWGYMDTTGKVVIAPIYTNAESFYQGLAKVKNWYGTPMFVDKAGRELIPEDQSMLYDADIFS